MALIKENFPDAGAKLKFDIVRDAYTTGNLEVSVNGMLIHSKNSNGDGYFHSNKKTQGAVFDAIGKAIVYDTAIGA